MNCRQCSSPTIAVLCLCPVPGPRPRVPSMSPGSSTSEDSLSSAPELQCVHRQVPPSLFPSVNDKSGLNDLHGSFRLEPSMLRNSSMPREVTKALLHATGIYWPPPIGKLCGTQTCAPSAGLGRCQSEASLWPLLGPDLSFDGG